MAKRTRIRVPTRQVDGGFEWKFDSDAYDVQLHGILSAEEYTSIVESVNQKIKPARSNAIDKGLLATGPLIVPLALWGVRHGFQAKKRKRLLNEAIREFNETHPDHYMRWNRRPQSVLTIERRVTEAAPGSVPPLPPSVAVLVAENSPAVSGGTDNVNNVMVADARLVV